MAVVRHWAEHGGDSPFPQEINVINKLSRYPAGSAVTFTRAEIEILYHWAEKETTGKYGTEKYLLEEESKLIEKIEDYLSS